MSTTIEWTEETWNPTTGCDRISAGCDNCYALRLAKRLKGMGSAKYQTDGDPCTSGPGFGLAVHPDTLDAPLHWREGRRVFVNSMSDLFHARVPREFVAKVFAVMAATPQHTYQVLTKRPERMARLLDGEFVRLMLLNGSQGGWGSDSTTVRKLSEGWAASERWPLPNVWLGTSVEDQATANRRIPALLETPAAVRFLSCEPLLGPVDLTEVAPGLRYANRGFTALAGDPRIDWVIAGGESGPGARPMEPAWVRDLRDQCAEAGTAFFFKQWGGRTPKANGRELDGRTWDEYPDRAEAVAR